MQTFPGCVLTELCIAVLRNDQQSLTEQLDKKLQEYFSEVSSRPRPQAPATEISRDQPQTSGRMPFTDAAVQPSGHTELARPFAVGKDLSK